MLEPLPIERITPPTVSDFYSRYVVPGKPVVITGMVNHWPALKLWDWKYFKDNFSDARVGAMRLKNGQYDFKQNNGSPIEGFSLGDVINSVEQGRADGLALASLVNSFPERLKKDYHTPVYCKDGKFQLTRLYIGPNNLVTPLHQDYPDNI
jgi:hypothetical protein